MSDARCFDVDACVAPVDLSVHVHCCRVRVFIFNQFSQIAAATGMKNLDGELDSRGAAKETKGFVSFSAYFACNAGAPAPEIPESRIPDK